MDNCIKITFKNIFGLSSLYSPKKSFWSLGGLHNDNNKQDDVTMTTLCPQSKLTTYLPKVAPPLMLLNSSSSELNSDSESGGSVRRSRWPDPFLVFFLLLSPRPIRAFNSFLFFIFFWGVSEPAEPDLKPTKSKVLSSLVALDAPDSSSFYASLKFEHTM